jgi:hypothetical protein
MELPSTPDHFTGLPDSLVDRPQSEPVLTDQGSSPDPPNRAAIGCSADGWHRTPGVCWIGTDHHPGGSARCEVQLRVRARLT